MRKNEITEISGIEHIINSAKVCTISMIHEGKPYGVPMNFGYENEVLFFHGASFGKKIDTLKSNPEVCVSIYTDDVLNVRNENVACSYSMKYMSALFYGEVVFLSNDDLEEKKRVMNMIMKKYTGRDDFDYNEPAIKNVSMFYLKPKHVKAFKRGY